MINKSAFSDFLEKCYLNKTIESFILKVENKKLTCDIKSGTALLGSIEYDKFDCEDCNIGVYNPDVLIKNISVLNNDTEIILKKKKDGINLAYIEFIDTKGIEVKYPTQDLDVFDIVEKKRAKIQEYDVVVNLNNELIESFLKPKSCINSSKIAFFQKGDELKGTFGYSSNTVDAITIPFPALKIDDIGVLLFNSDVLKEVFSTNNKRFETATLEISTRGIMRVFFKTSNGSSEYFLVKLQDEID